MFAATLPSWERSPLRLLLLRTCICLLIILGLARLVVLPDYQGIGVGKRLLNFIAELYTSQLDLPFYILTTNPQLIHGSLSNWKVKRVGHISGGRTDSRINREIRSSISKNRLTVTLQYIPKSKSGGATDG